jgi:hypothetical protein
MTKLYVVQGFMPSLENFYVLDDGRISADTDDDQPLPSVLLGAYSTVELAKQAAETWQAKALETTKGEQGEGGYSNIPLLFALICPIVVDAAPTIEDSEGEESTEYVDFKRHWA